MQRHASFAFLMAFVIGWSSVAFAVQKPIHQQMMNKASFVQANTVSAEVPHAMNMQDQKHSMQMSDCHQASAQSQQHTTSHCPPDLQQMNNMSQCGDCALWHCQSISSSLEMHSTHFQLPMFSTFSEQPNVMYSAKYLQGYKLKLLRPPKS